MDIARAIAKINSTAEYRLTSAQAQSAADIIEWRGPGPQPTEAQLDAAWSEIQAEDAEQQSTADAILGTASGAVGKVVTNLTSAERNSLLAVLMFSVGAIDRQGKVRPLNEWVNQD